MKVFLKKDTLPSNWVLVSEKGNIISGPVHFPLKAQAIEWASRFLSTWPQANLIVEE